VSDEVKVFKPTAPEVRRFRADIYSSDLNISPTWLSMYSSKSPPTTNKFAYWFSDEKFSTNGFDQVLLHYHDGEAVGMCCGTYFNKHLYRGVQMYYILKRFRRIRGLNTLHFRHGGFFDYQIERAKALNCKAIFISVDMFDRRHEIMFEAMKNDVVGPGHMPNTERKYTAKDLTYLDATYDIMYTPQRVTYMKLEDTPMTFDDMFYLKELT